MIALPPPPPALVQHVQRPNYISHYNCHAATMYGPDGFVNIQMIPKTDYAPFNIVLYNKQARVGIWSINVLVDGYKRWGFNGPYVKGNLHGTIPGKWLHKNGKPHIVWINGWVRSFQYIRRGKPTVTATRIDAVCMTETP